MGIFCLWNCHGLFLFSGNYSSHPQIFSTTTACFFSSFRQLTALTHKFPYLPLPTASNSFHSVTVATTHIHTSQLPFLKSEKISWQFYPSKTSYIYRKISKSTFSRLQNQPSQITEHPRNFTKSFQGELLHETYLKRITRKT